VAHLRLTGDCSPGEFAITRTVKEESLKIATKHTQVIFPCMATRTRGQAAKCGVSGENTPFFNYKGEQKLWQEQG
jgi:hypothetical protein